MIKFGGAKNVMKICLVVGPLLTLGSFAGAMDGGGLGQVMWVTAIPGILITIWGVRLFFGR